MADMTTHIKLIDGQAEVRSANHLYRVSRRDLPDEAFGCPVELLMGALGSWIALTMAAVADHKKIKLNTVEVHIGYSIQPGKKWLTSFSVKIDLGRGLSRRERTILFNSARLCEVTKLLDGEKKFEYELMSQG